MTNNDLEETNFTNDRLTDLIIHKDDEPMIENLTVNDSGNVTGLIEETDIPARDTNVTDCWFPIHFFYQDTDHTADVKKIQTTITEYHVFDVIPAIDHLPEPFVIAEHFSKEKFDFPVNEIYYPLTLGTTILKAINAGTNDSLHPHFFAE